MTRAKILPGKVYSGIYIVASDGKSAIYIRDVDIPGLAKAIRSLPKLGGRLKKHLKKFPRPWKSTTKISITTKLTLVKK